MSDQQYPNLPNYLINASEFNPEDENMDEVDRLMFHNNIMKQSLQLNQSIVGEEDVNVLAPGIDSQLNDLKQPFLKGDISSSKKIELRFQYVKDHQSDTPDGQQDLEGFRRMDSFGQREAIKEQVLREHNELKMQLQKAQEVLTSMTPENAKDKVTGRRQTLRTRIVTQEELEQLNKNQVYVMDKMQEIELRTVDLKNKATG